MKVLVAILLCLSLASRQLLAQDDLVVVSPHWEGMRREFAAGFTEDWKSKTGRAVTFHWLDIGGTSDILRYLKTGYATNPSAVGIDVFFGGGVDPYRELKKLGILARVEVPPEMLALMAPSVSGSSLYDNDLSWFSVTMNGLGILYNKKVLSIMKLPTPRSWTDLRGHESYGWIGSADPRKSGSAHLAFEIILQAYGWEDGWRDLFALGANMRGFSSSSTQVPKDVVVGEVAYGLVIDSQAYEAIERIGEENLGFIIPTAESAFVGDSVALLKAAPHPEIGAAFVKYTISTEGQRVLMAKAGSPGGPKEFTLGRIGVLPSMYTLNDPNIVKHVNPFATQDSMKYDFDKAGPRWAIVNDLIGTFIIDIHDELKPSILPENAAVRMPIIKIPVSESEVNEIAAKGLWDDQEFRNKTLSDWSVLAKKMVRHDETNLPLIWKLLPSVLALLLLIRTCVKRFLLRKR